ncbi:MAG: protein kinase [Candidatus Sumerlaeota bacterium]|nr:protein kinase [Candidatus Sumerlaeota bacterium]
MVNKDIDHDKIPANLPDDETQTWNPDQTRFLEPSETQPGDSPPIKDFDPNEATIIAETVIAATAVQPAAESQEKPPTAPVPGTLASNYTLQNVLGLGGFGEVWEGRQERLGRPVAIKLVRHDLHPAGAAEDDRIKFIQNSFQQEALTAASLDHPNIVPIYDINPDERGMPALAMKLVRGQPWSKVIAEDFPKMSSAEFLAKHLPIFIDLVQAVTFAHSRGIVHRDLKPAQVMIGDYGEVLLMDWGLGVLFDKDALENLAQQKSADVLANLETATNPAGTLAYMASEQTEAKATNIGPWTDVYLLGGILYQLLTGRPPHAGKTPMEVFEAARQGHVIPPREIAPGRDMPAELAGLCGKALQKDFRLRPPTAKEFLDELLDYQSGATRRQRSRDLAVHVASRVDQAAGAYEALSECQNLLAQARDLWPENPMISELSQRIFADYARAALNQGDLQLARLQAGSMLPGPGRDSLLNEADDRARRRRARERQRRIAMWLCFALGLLIIAGSIYYNHQVSDALGRARKAHADAEHLVTTLLDRIYARLEPLGQVKLMAELGGAIEGYFSTLAPNDRQTDSLYHEALALTNLHQVMAEMDNTTEALAMAQRAISILQTLAARYPQETKYEITLADAQSGLAGTVYTHFRDTQKAISLLSDASTTIDILRSENPEMSDCQSRSAQYAEKLAMMHFVTGGETTTAAEMIARAGAAWDLLRKTEPDNPRWREGAAENRFRVGQCDLGKGERNEAVDAFTSSANEWEKLASDFPINAAYKQNMARSLYWLGRAYERLGKMPEAEAAHKRALEIRQTLAAQDPNDLVLQWNLAVSTAKEAELALGRGDLKTCEQLATATLHILAASPKKAASDFEYLYTLGLVKLLLGNIAQIHGDMTAARKNWEESTKDLKINEAASPYDFTMLCSLTEVLLRLDKLREAEAVASKLRKIGFRGAGLSRMLMEKGLQPLDNSAAVEKQ